MLLNYIKDVSIYIYIVSGSAPAAGFAPTLRGHFIIIIYIVCL
jgi:hypothetical protein